MQTEHIEQSLVKYDQMCRAIAECHAIDEVKEIRDRAVAFAQYYKQARNEEAERQAAEIRLRAERRCGELLMEMAENGERDAGQGGDRKSRSNDLTVNTLEDLGVTKYQSSLWQKLAKIPEERFDELLARSLCQGAVTAQYIIFGYKHGISPEDFPEVTKFIETEHECPRCHYRWSGSSNSSRPPSDRWQRAKADRWRQMEAEEIENILSEPVLEADEDIEDRSLGTRLSGHEASVTAI